VTSLLYSFLFQRAREMSVDDIDDVVKKFVNAAVFLQESGFDGMQLHAAHGYLLAQFVSPKSNKRTDAYGEPLHLLHRLVDEIRAVVPPDFVLGIKLNSSDYAEGGLTEDQALSHIQDISTWPIDFIEISGGSYEGFEFLSMQTNPSKRQAFFEHFSRLAVKAIDDKPTENENGESSPRPRPLVLLTGGLWMPAQFSSVLEQNHAHLLGIGRRSVLFPDLPLILSRDTSMVDKDSNQADYEQEARYKELIAMEGDPSPPLPGWMPRPIGVGAGEAWYTVALHRIARGQPIPYGMSAFTSVMRMQFSSVL